MHTPKESGQLLGEVFLYFACRRVREKKKKTDDSEHININIYNPALSSPSNTLAHHIHEHSYAPICWAAARRVAAVEPVCKSCMRRSRRVLMCIYIYIYMSVIRIYICVCYLINDYKLWERTRYTIFCGLGN